jgi:putative phage-type endonuclease
MMNDHHDMLQPVLDTVGATLYFVPMGDHSSLQRSWLLETQYLMNFYMEEATIGSKDKSKAQNLLNLVNDAYAMFLKDAMNPEWQKMTHEERLAKVNRIKSLPQIEQRTQAWYDNYKSVLTASEFSGLFSSAKKRKDMIMSKACPPPLEGKSFRLACPTDEITAIGWGIRFENVVKQIIEYKDHSSIYEPGRLHHPTNPRLAASPDGIIDKSTHKQHVGRLVEIKCPYTRTIGGEIPFDYWIQMQVQMEVCDLDECEYIEVDIHSKRPNKEYLDMSGNKIRGFVYVCKQVVEEDQPFDYKYVYSDILKDKEEHKDPQIPEGYTFIEKVPWSMTKWHRKIVHRDREWFEATKPWQDAFWNDVDRVKNNEPLSFDVPQTPQRKIECLITDD